MEADQRRHNRVKTHIPVRYRRLNEDDGREGTSSLSRNVSEGGVRFRTAEFVSMASRLILEIEIPALDKPVRAIARVAWIRKADSGYDYEVGNQFLEMSKEDKKLILDYVNSLNEYTESGGDETGTVVDSRTLE